MSLGAAIDVSLGLIFCYLLLGLIGTSLQEALAGWRNLRGKQLLLGLRKLLANSGGAPDSLFDKIVGHSLVNPDPGGRAPAYIPAANFALALIDGLCDGSQAPLLSQVERGIAALPQGPARTALTALLTQAAGDLDAFKAGVARWFDDAMDRVSGVYKRIAHNRLLVFGALIAFGGNIDSIQIAHALWTDPVARAEVVQAATSAVGVATTPDQVASGVHAAAAALQALPIPMGWDGPPQFTFAKFIGCLATALAVSLGAPFWFDLLQKFLNIRTTGPKPAKAGDPE